MMLQLKANHEKINLIPVYITDESQQEVVQFNEQINTVLKEVNNRDITLVISTRRLAR